MSNNAFQAFTLTVSQLSILPTALEASVGEDATRLPPLTATGGGSAVTTYVPASAGLYDPTGLAFDSSGNLYVANYNSNTVSEVTPSGTVSTLSLLQQACPARRVWPLTAAATSMLQTSATTRLAK